MRLTPLAVAGLLAACHPTAADNQINDSDALAVEGLDDGSAGSGGPATDPGDAPSANPDDSVSSDDLPSPVPSPGPSPPKSDCPIVKSSGWQAHVDAMPGPNSRPKLIVRGDVTVPTGGYNLSLRMGAIAESYPVQITVHLVARPPSGPASQSLVTHEVRGSWPSPQRVGSVTVRCDGKALARISPVETAL